MSSLHVDPKRRGRPRAVSDDEALHRAMLTFWEKGFRATSIDDLVAETGTPRATLYKSFGDKRDIFIRALGRYGDLAADRIEAALGENRSMSETARMVLTASAERLSGETSLGPGGCLRCASTLELSGGGDAQIDLALAAANRRYAELMGRIVERGVASGEVAPDARVRLAVFLTGAVAGMVMLARSGLGRGDLLAFVDTTVAALADAPHAVIEPD